MTMTPIVRHRMRITLFVLFVATFGLTVVATIWAFLLQAGAFGTPSVTEVKHLGTLITGVIVEVVAGVIALWYDLFGLRQTQATAEEQPVPEYFERKLTNCVVAIRKGNILECHSPANAVVYPANVYFDTTFDDDIVDPKRSTLGMYLAERGNGSHPGE